MMAAGEDPLLKAGLHFDDLHKLRILDPEIAQQTTQLKDECGEFMERIKDFKTIVDGFITMVDGLSKAVEEEKIKAIGARNLLKSMSKQREAQQQQLQSLITEKKMEMERLRVEYESLLKVQADQEQLIDDFVSQK